jgi:hypothetical protein
MRTKTLLMSAAALLAAGIVSSQAQPVYSQNIVGYANVVAPSAYVLMCVPFNVDSVGNNATNVFGASLPDTTQVLLWNSAAGKFVTDVYDTGAGYNTPPYWFMSDDATPTNPPSLPTGQAFYLFAPGGVTNVFAGTVSVPVGGTNTQVLGSFYNLVGSTIPYAGSATNTSVNLGNLDYLGNPTLPDTTQVLLYNSNSGKYVTDVYDTGAGYNTPPYWFMSDDSTPTNPPSLTVGQGVFVFPPGGGKWIQTLQSN